jgi:hypothetical protein
VGQQVAPGAWQGGVAQRVQQDGLADVMVVVLCFM